MDVKFQCPVGQGKDNDIIRKNEPGVVIDFHTGEILKHAGKRLSPWIFGLISCADITAVEGIPGRDKYFDIIILLHKVEHQPSKGGQRLYPYHVSDFSPGKYENPLEV